MSTSVPNRESDKIQSLIEAAQAEERAKLAVESILREIHDRLGVLERQQQEIVGQLTWVKQIAQTNYTNINILIQLMSAIWRDDRESLSDIQQKVAERAFAEAQRDEAAMNVKVEAGGDVRLSSDKVGRDKREVDRDEEKKTR